MTLVAAAALPAQDAPLGVPAPQDRECTCAFDTDGHHAFRYSFGMNRARIGVELGEPAQAAGQTGIRLRSVAEGGPADRAGIRSGDILLSLDGAALGDEPADRLIELLADVEPGDTVTVSFSRDGRQNTARIVTDQAARVSVFGPGEREGAWSFPRVRAVRERALAPGARLHLRQLFGGELELVAMNEGLGRYFDSDTGVLVASLDEDSALGLRPGDVILTIGGRAVQDPAHARSIIASYRPDETITFEVMRDRRRTPVTGTRQGD